MNPDIKLGEFNEKEFTDSSVNNMMRFTDFSPLSRTEESAAESAIALH
ncbi:hypothetical protein OG782_17155 [Streptomyces sp. NBC_00876]|nr:hypothetical protein OG782_17155 [Streptomyces sp. NBC_00876]